MKFCLLNEIIFYWKMISICNLDFYFIKNNRTQNSSNHSLDFTTENHFEISHTHLLITVRKNWFQTNMTALPSIWSENVPGFKKVQLFLKNFSIDNDPRRQ
jgi:hypothetical protein